jgi:hypothetical protein
MPDIGLFTAPLQVPYNGLKCLSINQRFGAAVLDYELKLIRHKAPIQRHDNPANLCDSDKRLDKLNTIHQTQCDPITVPHAQKSKLMAEPIGPHIQFGEGESGAARSIDIGLSIRANVRSAGEERSNIHIHATRS